MRTSTNLRRRDARKKINDIHGAFNDIYVLFVVVFGFFSRATDQQYGIRTFEDNSKLHGHTNEHVQFEGAHEEINRSLLPCRHTDNDIYTSA